MVNEILIFSKYNNSCVFGYFIGISVILAFSFFHGIHSLQWISNYLYYRESSVTCSDVRFFFLMRRTQIALWEGT